MLEQCTQGLLLWRDDQFADHIATGDFLYRLDTILEFKNRVDHWNDLALFKPLEEFAHIFGMILRLLLGEIPPKDTYHGIAFNQS